MKINYPKQSFILVSLLFFQLLAGPFSFSQNTETTFVYGDALPDAPELAARGEYKIGVRTLDFVNKNQIDVLKTKDNPDARYDRTLKVEVWYPAVLSAGQPELVSYEEVMGTSNDPKRPLIPFTFQGRAARDAAPLASAGAFPLIVVSHGYVGSRYLLTYLTENLASKGYVVVAIDHAESTFRDAAGFTSTLLNRSKDILFVLDLGAEVRLVGENLIDKFGLLFLVLGGSGGLGLG